ncbi:MAG: hypothetical protein LBL39_07400, partial [Planctomycetaceae bacterium]|nr:hypothetical protein [Planctomycetaceae bacterium]
MIQSQVISYLLFDLLIILTAGFISGVICRRFRLPMVVGYLLIGAFIGNGVLHILHVENVPEPESAEVVEISLPDSVIPSITSQDQDTNNTNTESSTPHAGPDPVDQTITQVTENDSNNESELSPESNGTAIRAEHIL